METGFNKRVILSQINVTPFVDVMLVLLIIFMVTTPMLQEGLDVNLPVVKANALSVEEEPIIITITEEGKLFINKNKITLTGLDKKLNAIYSRKKEKMVLIRADEKVPYGFVIRTMAEIRKAGIERIGMVTEPQSKIVVTK
jgi:biopolymer transport protein TolR